MRGEFRLLPVRSQRNPAKYLPLRELVLPNHGLLLTHQDHVWTHIRRRPGSLQPDIQCHSRQKRRADHYRGRGRTYQSVASPVRLPHLQPQRYSIIDPGHSDFLNKIDTSPCNKYLMSSAGDGLRFFDLLTLQPLGGWKTGSIHEVAFDKFRLLRYFTKDKTTFCSETPPSCSSFSKGTSYFGQKVRVPLSRTAQPRRFLSVLLWGLHRERQLSHFGYFPFSGKHPLAPGARERADADCVSGGPDGSH